MPGRAHNAGQEEPRPIEFPERYNAAEALIDRHVPQGRGAKAALRTPEREVSYAELAARVNRYGNALLELGLGRGERLLMLVSDCPEFVYLFWGAIKAGIVPVPLNTMLRPRDYAYIVADSQCGAIAASAEFAAAAEEACAGRGLAPARVLRVEGGDASLAARAARAPDTLAAAPARPDDDCFWLYSSGTTGQPKGIVHAQRSIAVTCQRFAEQTLGARADDVFFSVPRLYFSYGLGIAMNFPFWVGGTAVLDARRPTPATVAEVFRRCAPTVFAAVPTFYVALLAAGGLGAPERARLRRCLSGGEAMPPEVWRRWREATGVPIMEVLGSTEMLHIYLANPVDAMRPGTAGLPVPGYEVKRVANGPGEADAGAPQRLWVRGQSMMKRYWSNPGKTAATIVDGWLDTGDLFTLDEAGYYVYCGRADDMLKVGGRWVSPFEVESALVSHPDVLEAAVVGLPDASGLTKAAAWVVLRDPARAGEAAAEEIRAHCKRQLAPYKYPHWIHFVAALPKTATGKIQRYKLRAPAAP